jgi:cerevisin
MKISIIAILVFSSFIEAQNKRYIIGFKKNASTSIASNLDSIDNTITGTLTNNTDVRIFDGILFGMTAILSGLESVLVRALPNVAFVEEDGIATGAEIQSGASWGLGRISHSNLLDWNTYDKYNYDPNSGNDVTVYIIDTGVNVNHVDFEGRAVFGANFVRGSSNYDENGHGTHCAGTIGSKTYGVAKKARLVSVKVFDKNNRGSWSNVVAGFNWAVKNARGKKAIISYSGGGGVSQAMDRAASDAYDSGVFVIAAALNDNKDACNYSPGRSNKVLTVGATDINDKKASFSNWGKCVDILAPGVGLISTGISSNNATKVLSGTSMAAPHIAGLAATFLSQGVSFSNLKSILINTGTKNVISGFASDTPNILGNNGYNS